IGFANEQIVILSCVGQGKSFLGDAAEIGGIKLKRATTAREGDGTQVYTQGDILFETVFRFKGQQAPAVILIDGNKPEHATDYMKRVMFCGMTRATVRLDVLTVLRWLT
ncbi:MAG: ATP-binding domain-containing protein, partial [Gammaproteobacteria bacterium]|nr:ATP-binding domain-containing protein [Gammaproteobacteria bacterium]